MSEREWWQDGYEEIQATRSYRGAIRDRLDWDDHRPNRWKVTEIHWSDLESLERLGHDDDQYGQRTYDDRRRYATHRGATVAAEKFAKRYPPNESGGPLFVVEQAEVRASTRATVITAIVASVSLMLGVLIGLVGIVDAVWVIVTMLAIAAIVTVFVAFMATVFD